MKKRYSIWVREYGSDHDVELMQVDSNPRAITTGLHQKMLTINTGTMGRHKKTKLAKYTYVRVVDNERQ